MYSYLNIVFFDKTSTGSGQYIADLPADALHAFHRGMAPLFVDVVQADIGDAVVTAYTIHRLGDGVGQFGIRNVVNPGMRIMRNQVIEQVAESRTEIIEIVFLPIGILIMAQGRAGPTVVGASEKEYDVRIPQIGHAGDEGSVRVVFSIISGIADSRSGIGIVGVEPVAITVQQQLPPGLFERGDIVFFLLAGDAVPAEIGARGHVAVEG